MTLRIIRSRNWLTYPSWIDLMINWLLGAPTIYDWKWNSRSHFKRFPIQKKLIDFHTEEDRIHTLDFGFFRYRKRSWRWWTHRWSCTILTVSFWSSEHGTIPSYWRCVPWLVPSLLVIVSSLNLPSWRRLLARFSKNWFPVTSIRWDHFLISCYCLWKESLELQRIGRKKRSDSWNWVPQLKCLFSGTGMLPSGDWWTYRKPGIVETEVWLHIFHWLHHCRQASSRSLEQTFDSSYIRTGRQKVCTPTALLLTNDSITVSSDSMLLFDYCFEMFFSCWHLIGEWHSNLIWLKWK